MESLLKFSGRILTGPILRYGSTDNPPIDPPSWFSQPLTVCSKIFLSSRYFPKCGDFLLSLLETNSWFLNWLIRLEGFIEWWEHWSDACYRELFVGLVNSVRNYGNKCIVCCNVKNVETKRAGHFFRCWKCKQFCVYCTCNFKCGRRSCCLLHVQWNLVC